MKKVYKIKLKSPMLHSLLIFEKRVSRFKIKKMFRLPKKKKKFRMQKSPFVHSKAKEHFQLTTHIHSYTFFLSFEELKKIILLVPMDVLIIIEENI